VRRLGKHEIYRITSVLPRYSRVKIGCLVFHAMQDGMFKHSHSYEDKFVFYLSLSFRSQIRKSYHSVVDDYLRSFELNKFPTRLYIPNKLRQFTLFYFILFNEIFY